MACSSSMLLGTASRPVQPSVCPLRACVLTPHSRTADFDVAGVHFIEGLLEELRGQGLRLALANPSHQVRAFCLLLGVSGKGAPGKQQRMESPGACVPGWMAAGKVPAAGFADVAVHLAPEKPGAQYVLTAHRSGCLPATCKWKLLAVIHTCNLAAGGAAAAPLRRAEQGGGGQHLGQHDGCGGERAPVAGLSTAPRWIVAAVRYPLAWLAAWPALHPQLLLAWTPGQSQQRTAACFPQHTNTPPIMDIAHEHCTCLCSAQLLPLPIIFNL